MDRCPGRSLRGYAPTALLGSGEPGDGGEVLGHPPLKSTRRTSVEGREVRRDSFATQRKSALGARARREDQTSVVRLGRFNPVTDIVKHSRPSKLTLPNNYNAPS
jgi:hypothetical protein